jgi:hypothetical protein
LVDDDEWEDINHDGFFGEQRDSGEGTLARVEEEVTTEPKQKKSSFWGSFS